VDFSMSPQAAELHDRLSRFLHERVVPSEAEYDRFRAERGPDDHTLPPVVERLKEEARALGLWNLFLPEISGLSNVDYAPLAELTGWSAELAPEALNCAAPDTGNMELLHRFGTPEQRERWLRPLLDGAIRSGFAMTEPDVASSDAANIECRIERRGDEYVVNGRKWWTSGLLDERCRVLVVMGKTDPDGPKHRQQSMVLVPVDAPGVEVVRDLPVFGYVDQHGHGEVRFTDVRVPVANLLGEEGQGFAMAQARLGPGRIHHCMRALGAAERALELLCRRASTRIAFGRPLADQGMVHEAIAESRLAIEQARLLTLKTAWLVDRHGAKGAAQEIAAIKVAAPRAALAVIDRAIQVHGGAGVGPDVPLGRMWAWHRAMRIFDGPDEVHLRSLARSELRRHQPPGGSSAGS
jgi:acyl-CoA dehydrogenase